MADFEVRESWLSVIEKQEKELVFENFDSSDSFVVGLKIIELAEKKYKQPVAVSIEIDNGVVFSHMMKGTGLGNKLWMARKINVSKITKESSLRTCLKLAYTDKEPEWLRRQDSFAVCGGCWPVRIDTGEQYAFITVSGLEHYLDHQIIVDALSDFLGRKTDTVSI